MNKEDQKDTNNGSNPSDLLETLATIAAQIPAPFNSYIEKAILFRISLEKETDRGAALMAAGFIDELLKDLLTAFLVDDNKVARDVFGLTGALSTFSSRIDFAYLLGLLPRSLRNELHVIRSIRNKFAHEAGFIDFDTDYIARECRKLTQHGTDIKTAPPDSLYRRSALAIVMYVLLHTGLTEHRPPADDVPNYNTDGRVTELLGLLRLAHHHVGHMVADEQGKGRSQ